ncbi:hypothetical protein HanHA89_Chr01g0030891 [Helianthus annuus]|nr:hypothetical protein HanHA89_Chr01g0030891 [Helianthus annuus]
MVKLNVDGISVHLRQHPHSSLSSISLTTSLNLFSLSFNYSIIYHSYICPISTNKHQAIDTAAYQRHQVLLLPRGGPSSSSDFRVSKNVGTALLALPCYSYGQRRHLH